MTPANAAERLRGAVEAGDYKRAAGLLDPFRAAVEEAVAGAPDRALAILGSALEDLARMRSLALCQRAQMASQLATLSLAGAYLPARSRRGAVRLTG